MPFNQNTITKYRKKWFHFKSRTGSPTISHFDEVGSSSILIPIPNPIDLDHPSVDYPYFVVNDSVQCNEASTSTNIFSLPTELLAMIFLFCTIPQRIMIFECSRAPINLTQTCQLWREVAVGTPQLWSTLLPTRHTPIDMIELWLSRARHYPLVFDLTFDFGMPRNFTTQQRLLAILTNHMSNVVDLSLSGSIPHSTILGMGPSNFPKLISASWSWKNFSNETKAFDHFWSIARSIPSLQSVAIDRIPPIGPWNKITSLWLFFGSFANAPVHDTLQTLAQCTRLSRLNWFIDRTDSGIAFFSPIVIPKLDHLTLRFLDKLDQGPILDALIVPDVHHISIITGRGHPAMFKSLTRLLHRSQARLQSFELYGPGRDEQPSLIPFFKEPCLNTLRRVVIENCSMLEIVWAAFSDTTFLPSLEDLQLGVGRNLAIDNVVSYLGTRESQDTKLARVVFFVCCICDMESEEVREKDTLYHGCRELHPPWNTVRQETQLHMDIQVIPWGDRECFRDGDVNNV